MGEIVTKVMEGESRDHFPLALRGLGLELAEPVVDRFFRGHFQTSESLPAMGEDSLR